MNTWALEGRRPYAVIALAWIGLLGYAYYAEFVMGLEPCPLCMLQRLGFMGVLFVALIALAHGPKTLGRRLYAIPMVVSAGWGVTTSYRHLWLQSLPADEVPDCGPGLEFMQSYGYTWTEILTEAFTGAGQCAEIDWVFLGLSMPAWTLIWYVALMVFVVATLFWGQGGDNKSSNQTSLLSKS